MGRDVVKVCVRTRPSAHFAQDQIVINQAANSLTVRLHDAPDDGLFNNRDNSLAFDFHHLMHNSSQESMYENICRDTVQGVVDGINGCIFSYGQTGSGKTFTMIGDTQNFEHRGVAPRALAHVFGEIAQRPEMDMRVTCTYMEIYNERIYDLLGDLGNSDARTDFTIAEDRNGKGTFVRGLTEVEVGSEEEALNLLFAGELGRTTAQHLLNRNSNRSHSIFTVYVAQRPKSGVSERVLTSKLNLVDLAGSERLKKTLEMSDGRVLDDTLKKESMCINQSLTYLEQCVVALSRKGTSHVPYRQSKLTNVLKDSLGGNCRTTMIACIWGESAHIEETVSTLRLASRMMRVKNKTHAVEILDPMQMIKKQERIIKELKQELLMHDALSERSGIVYDPFTPEQQEDIRTQVRKYIAATSVEDAEDALQIKSVRHMYEMCEQFKQIIKDIATDPTAMASGDGGEGRNAGDVAKALLDGDGLSPAGDEEKEGGTFVGREDKTGGFSIGRAADDSRPFSKGPISPVPGSPTKGTAPDMPLSPTMGGFDMAEVKTGPESDYDAKAEADYKADVAAAPDAEPDLEAVNGDKERAFSMYKLTLGKEINEQILSAKHSLKNLRGRAKAAASSVNASKIDIDDLAETLRQRQEDRAKFQKNEAKQGDDQIVEEEDFNMMKRLSAAKRNYRSAFKDLQSLRQEIAAYEREVESLKYELLTNFDTWFSSALANLAAGGSKSNTDLAELDDGEKFQVMEERRVLEDNPDALAFFHAQKTKKATLTQNSVALRQLHRNKRNL
eukprot:CAMPEP_0118854086 /NCGR_PEP_ID=MMETSP1163-20130328/2427_1 /TAXON_ID=124430 /ORGANISM="Phaeomonas parva, Strain CCMP2877" /LENGTH=785 /DNA_ID=CAMNT_0006786743 /DNA_START=54 /DNA_END=2411 /DNA_ORIENTATION=-